MLKFGFNFRTRGVRFSCLWRGYPTKVCAGYLHVHLMPVIENMWIKGTLCIAEIFTFCCISVSVDNLAAIVFFCGTTVGIDRWINTCVAAV